MKGILRVHKTAAAHRQTAMAEIAAPPVTTTLEDYFQRLYKLIPGEIMGLYLVGSGVIPQEKGIVLLVWTIFCAVCLILLRYRLTSDATNTPQKGAILIALVSFVIWIYTLGGAFTLVKDLHEPYLGSLLVIGWTFVVPMFYKGDSDSGAA
ncbi:MAG: hypothetical protein ABNH00_10400 [Dokdonia sp.]|jgi:hypothetical protein